MRCVIVDDDPGFLRSIGFLTKSALSAAASAEMGRAHAEGGDAAP